MGEANDSRIMRKWHSVLTRNARVLIKWKQLLIKFLTVSLISRCLLSINNNINSALTYFAGPMPCYGFIKCYQES